MSESALFIPSFGCSYPETTEKNIHALENTLADAFPQHRVYHAFTSNMIRAKLLKRDQIKIPSPREAIEEILEAGYRNLLVQPSHIIAGHEYQGIKALLESRKEQFAEVRLGQPLLDSQSELQEIVKALSVDLDQYSKAASTTPAGETATSKSKQTALVYMGHGSDHKADAVYAKLLAAMRAAGYEDVYIATLEGGDSLEQLMPQLTAKAYSAVHLLPLMLVAGDHAQNDMAGPAANSWKNRLEDAGFTVSYELRGLGEIPAIREVFVKRAEAAQPF